jgi:hypothetical protein
MMTLWTGLQRASRLAVEALERNLMCGKAPTEVRAAEIILQNAIRAVEVDELQARVEQLEQMATTRNR